MAGMARPGTARRGEARHRRHREAGLGWARLGTAGTTQTATGERGINGRIHNEPSTQQ